MVSCNKSAYRVTIALFLEFFLLASAQATGFVYDSGCFHSVLPNGTACSREAVCLVGKLHGKEVISSTTHLSCVSDQTYHLSVACRNNFI